MTDHFTRWEGDSSGLVDHLFTEHGVAAADLPDPPPSDAGGWSVLDDLHHVLHEGRPAPRPPVRRVAGMDAFEIARSLRAHAEGIDREAAGRSNALRKMAQEAEYAALYGVKRVVLAAEPETIGTVVELRTPGMGCVAFVRWDGPEHARDVVSGTPYAYDVLRPAPAEARP